MLSILCITTINCLPDNSPEKENITCSVTAADKAGAKNLFNTGNYTFNTAGASITTGTSNGLNIGAGITSDNGDRRINIIIFLPAGKKFGAYRDGDSIEYRAPAVPFTITEKYFGTNKSHYSIEEMPYIKMEEFNRKRIDYFEAKYIWFENFSMKFTEFRIKKKKLCMRASFEGRVVAKHEKMHGAGFTITGDIDIHNAPLGRMFVD